MAALKAIGHWLDGSGWCDALVQAGVTTQGVAESLPALSATFVKCARVTAAALPSITQMKTYQPMVLTTGVAEIQNIHNFIFGI